jgi:hypothetical protein
MKFDGPRQKNSGLSICLALKSLISSLVSIFFLFFLFGKKCMFTMPIGNEGLKPYKVLDRSWKWTMLPNKRGTNFETKFLWTMHMLRPSFFDLGSLKSIPKTYFQMCVVSTWGGGGWELMAVDVGGGLQNASLCRSNKHLSA